MSKNAWIIGIVVVVALLLCWSWWARNAGPAPSPVTHADPSTLPGIATTTAPWPVETANLKDRLNAFGMDPQTMEGQVQHTHQHVDILIGGQPVVVPPNIGIHPSGAWLSAIHTHDTRGIIHVESPYVAAFTLGQFFDTWGVLFTSECIGGYCANASSTLKVYVNGALHEGDPRTIELGARQQIAVIYGTEEEMPAEIPATYGFRADE